MFCNQCEQTAKGTGCTVAGVCGKSADVAVIQDQLIYLLRRLAALVLQARAAGIADTETDDFMVEALFGTLTNVNFDPEALRKMQAETLERAKALAARLGEIDDAHLDARLPVDGTQKELKNLAQAINAMLDRIDQSYRAQMRFVSDASHELRTPISVIQGYANLLNRWGKDDPEAMQESIDAITQEAQSMKELVEQLLFLARGDNDSLVVEPEVFDLTAVAGQVMRDSQVIDQTHPMEAHWEGPVFVNCDLGLTKQAIRILVDNAIKYTPDGGHIAVTGGGSGRSGKF